VCVCPYNPLQDPKLDTRLNNIYDHFTYSLYCNVCRYVPCTQLSQRLHSSPLSLALPVCSLKACWSIGLLLRLAVSLVSYLRAGCLAHLLCAGPCLRRTSSCSPSCCAAVSWSPRWGLLQVSSFGHGTLR
jgi:hypothetical protein